MKEKTSDDANDVMDVFVLKMEKNSINIAILDLFTIHGFANVALKLCEKWDRTLQSHIVQHAAASLNHHFAICGQSCYKKSTGLPTLLKHRLLSCPKVSALMNGGNDADYDHQFSNFASVLERW
jgi:hypothetical protein